MKHSTPLKLNQIFDHVDFYLGNFLAELCCQFWGEREESIHTCCAKPHHHVPQSTSL